jgi:unsaturated rhamnogalacturonyl hydrolase
MKKRNILSIVLLLIPFIMLQSYPLYNGYVSGNNDLANSTYKTKTTNTAWSVLMANAVMHKYPQYASYGSTNIRWNYELGVILYAFWKVWQKTNSPKYLEYIKNNIDYFITDSGRIKTYDFNKFRLDDICTGRILLDLYKKTGEHKYKIAADLLRKQLLEQPRTPEGGFWHKQIYPEQMWLDGLYMAEPFYAQYAKMFNEPQDFTDIAKQFILMAKHAKDPKTGLFYHGWDYSKKQKWANPKTGDSPSFWGRGMGWYLMGLVDVLDYVPVSNPDRTKVINVFKDLCQSLLKFQDKETHLWYLVIDKPNKKKNYFESSASAMFMYAFAKGANEGYLNKKYLTAAKQVFNSLVNNSIKIDKDGYPELYNTISGAGLGGHPYRDGTFHYYAGEPKRMDDFKGLGPFILGCLQLEKDHLIK